MSSPSRKPLRSLLRSQRGVVMMEFLIALLPVMIMFLGMAQFSMAAVAKLLVRHSAVVGARAAVVVLEESVDVLGTPEELYDGAPAGDLQLDEDDSGGDPAETQGAELQQAGSQANNSGPLQDQIQGLMEIVDRGHSRIAQIRTAAYFPLLAISPDLLSDGFGFLFGSDALSSERQTVRDAIGDTGILRIVGAFLYNLGAVAVTFPSAPGSDETKEGPYAHGDEVTVRVTYMMRCNVPIASLLLCDSGLALLVGTALIDPGLWWELRNLPPAEEIRAQNLPAQIADVQDALDRYDRRQERIDGFNEHSDELDQAESPIIQTLLMLRPGARYMLIQAEATLPVQSARYYPRAEASEGGGGES
jgi:hypothetical protein